MIFDSRRTKNLILTVGLRGASSVIANSYQLASSIPFAPKNITSVDQSTIYNSTYYLAGRVNSGIHIVNLADEKQTALSPGSLVSSP